MIKMIDNECITVRSAIRCESIDEAELLMDWLDENGYTWDDGDRYTEFNMWDKYKNNTGYRILDGVYCDLNNFRGKIIKFDKAFDIDEFIKI